VRGKECESNRWTLAGKGPEGEECPEEEQEKEWDLRRKLTLVG